MAPNISVLITYHNEGELLTRCLKSFAAQPVNEILVFDDASTIRPESFIPRLSIPVRVIRSEKNVGPAQGRNVLLAEAQGEFIHFHDSDDWVMDGWHRVSGAIGTGVDAVFTEVSSYREGSLVVELVQELRYLDTRDPLAFALTHFLLVPSGTYRKSIVQKMGGYSDQWQSEDYYFHAKFLSLNPRLVLLLEPLVGIDLRPTSRSTKTVEVWCCTLDVLKRLSAELDPRHRLAMSEMAYQAGSILFGAGSPDNARRAFQFAKALGSPKLLNRNLVYRKVAQMNPMMAERLGTYYRACLPSSLRNLLRGNR